MTIDSTVHFHNLERTDALIDDVEKHVQGLARFSENITDCHVTIEAPHQHHHRGGRYKVMIRLSVPGDTLVVSHEDDSSPSHENCYVTIHDAFRSARRQLQDYERIRRHQTKEKERAAKRKFRDELGQ